MKLSVVPSHKELFGYDFYKFEHILKSYNKRDILGYLSVLNAQVFAQSNKSQFELIEKISSVWEEDLRLNFKNKVKSYLETTKGNIFNTLNLTFFINVVLVEYPEINTKPLDIFGEYLVIKAYFHYVGEYNKEFEVPKKEFVKGEENYFQKLIWPHFLKQFEFNEKPDIIYLSIKLYVLLDYFSKNVLYKEYVDNYLKINKKETSWNLIFDFFSIIRVSFEKASKFELYNSIIQVDNEYMVILDNLSVNLIENYNLKISKENFSILKKKPIFKTKNNTYFVLNWLFLYNQLYTGFLFDFHTMSGIKSILNFETYKSIIGKSVAEEIILRSLFKYSFNSKYFQLIFDNKESDTYEKIGLPDSYLRIGKYIFLFEIKDYLFLDNITNSATYETIKEYIDLRFINNGKKGKGISQIIKQINDIYLGKHLFDNIEKNGLKYKNLVIIPVIITTSYNYQLPGINTYLNNQFKKNIKSGIDVKYQANIFPLTFIDLKYFFQNLVYFKQNPRELKNQIELYHSTIKSLKKQIIKTPDFDTDMKIHSSFEELIKKSKIEKEGFIKEVFNAFNINENL